MCAVFVTLYPVVKYEVIACITMNLFLAFLGHGFNGMYAYIQFVPNKQYQGVDVNDDHQYDDGTNGAV